MPVGDIPAAAGSGCGSQKSHPQGAGGGLGKGGLIFRPRFRDEGQPQRSSQIPDEGSVLIGGLLPPAVVVVRNG